MKPLLLALISCYSLSMLAADPKPTAGVLNRWVGGTWPLEGKMLDSDYSKAMTVTGVSNCAWSPDRVFVVCDQSIVADGAHWEYLSNTEVKGKAVQFRTINEFRTADHIDWWSEYSTDGGAHWVKMGGGSEKRVQ